MFRNRKLLVTLFSTLACIACWGLTCVSCQAGSAPDSAKDAKITSSAVGTLDDPANPYMSQYGPWDQWIYAHLGEPQWDKPGTPLPADYHTLTAYIDSSGWLVPLKVQRKNLEESIKFRSRCANDDYRELTSSGILSPEEYQQELQAHWEVSASYYPQVPFWLVSNMPYMAMLLPNGNIVTIGELGTSNTIIIKQEGSNGCCGGNGGLPFCLYDASGKLIGKSDLFWWYISADQAQLDNLDDRISQRSDGYFICRADTGEITSIYEYDGSKLPSNAEPAERDYHSFIWLRPDQLRHLFHAQH